MKLTELLDTPPTKADYESNSSGHYSMRFTTKNGQEVSVFFKQSDNDGEYDLVFTVDDKMGVTGQGETGEIFSTILDFIKRGLSKLPSGSKIEFSSVKPSRSKLYKRILDLRLKSPYGYDSYTLGKTITIFTITKEGDDNEIN